MKTIVGVYEGSQITYDREEERLYVDGNTFELLPDFKSHMEAAVTGFKRGLQRNWMTSVFKKKLLHKILYSFKSGEKTIEIYGSKNALSSIKYMICVNGEYAGGDKL